VKFSVQGQKERKLVAVVGVNGGCLFRIRHGVVVYTNSVGDDRQFPGFTTLEAVLASDSNRTPVYEGDKVVIEF